MAFERSCLRSADLAFGRYVPPENSSKMNFLFCLILFITFKFSVAPWTHADQATNETEEAVIPACQLRNDDASDYCNQQVFDTVAARLCEPHGHCVNDDDRARCVCKPGYFGRTCDQQSDSDFYCSLEIFGQSAASRCKGGKCIGSALGTRCECQPNYIGEECEIEKPIDFCELQYGILSPSHECRVRGTCVNGPNGATCVCLPDYEGPTCQVKIGNSSSSIALIGGLDSAMLGVGAIYEAELYVPPNSSHSRIYEQLSIDRVHHVAVVVDPELLVVGGVAAGGRLHLSQTLAMSVVFHDGWKKHPDTIEQRFHSSGAGLGQNLIVCGGLDSKSRPVRSCEMLEGLEQWKKIASMNETRYRSAALVFGEQFCMLAGAAEYDNSLLKSVECWDLESDSWSLLAALPSVRYYHAAAIYNHTMVTCGGFVCDHNTYLLSEKGADECVLDECLMYSAKTDEWLPMPAMNRRRRGHSMVNFNGQLMAMGGASSLSVTGAHGVAADDPTLRSVEYFDNISGEWVETVGLIEPRFVSSAVLLD